MNFASNNIKVYPTTSRNVASDPFSRLNLEQNIVRGITSIVDYSSYIVSGIEITPTLSEGSVTSIKIGPGQLVLEGYNVELVETTSGQGAAVLSGSTLPTSSSGWYLYFKLNLSTSNNITTINGTDNSSNIYTGIELGASSTLPSTSDIFTFAYVSVTGDVSTAIMTSASTLSNTTKVSGDNVAISCAPIYGLIDAGNSFNSHLYNLNDWAENHFIVDDGGFNIESNPTILQVDFYGGESTSYKLLNGHTTLPDALKQQDITYINIPYNITEIPYQYFAGNENLSMVILPNTLTAIRDKAFNGCTNLQSIHIPMSVTSIGTEVFTDCEGLLSIQVDPWNQYYDSRNDCNAIIAKVPNSTNGILLYGCRNTVIPNNITKIGEKAFQNQIELTSITIPSNISIIDKQSFLGCDNLTSVIFSSTDNWYIRDSLDDPGTPVLVDLSDAFQAALFLRDTSQYGAANKILTRAITIHA